MTDQNSAFRVVLDINRLREFSELGIMSIGPDNVASLIYSAQTRCEFCPANTYGVFTDTPKTNPDDYGEGESYERTSTCADCPAGRTSPPRSTSVDQCVLAPTHKMGRRAALARVGACDRGLTACLLTDDTWEWCVAKSRRSHCLKLTPYPVLPTASTLKTTFNQGGCWSDGTGEDCTLLLGEDGEGEIECVAGSCQSEWRFDGNDRKEADDDALLQQSQSRIDRLLRSVDVYVSRSESKVVYCVRIRVLGFVEGHLIPETVLSVQFVSWKRYVGRVCKPMRSTTP